MESELARLRWRSRRGLLELDLLFSAYIERVLPGANAAERASFERLLQHPDADLLAWLKGDTEPLDYSLRPIMARLRRLPVTGR